VGLTILLWLLYLLFPYIHQILKLLLEFLLMLNFVLLLPLEGLKSN
jgi:hypothetical protein